jgi:ankyrin repeat protein
MDINKFFASNDWIDMIKNIKLSEIKKTIINGNNLLHLAAIRGRADILNFIITKYPELVYIANGEGDTIGHLLIKNGYYEIMKDIVKKHPDILTLVNAKGEIISQAAIDDPLVLGWLIDTMPPEYKDSYNNLTYEGWTLLLNMIKHTTANDVYIDLMSKLIMKGANVNYPQSNPPLNYATVLNKPNVVKILLNNSADPNIRDKNGITPLMRSIMNNNYDITKQLIDHGADINYGGSENDNVPINLAILKRSDKLINLLVDSGADMMIRDRYLNTPVHYLLQANKTDKWILPSILFKAIHTADLNLQNIKGTTPLHMLTKYNMWNNYTELLRQKPIDLSIQDQKNKTPLNYLQATNLTKFINVIAEGKIDNTNEQCNGYKKYKCLTYIRSKLLSNKKINQRKLNRIINMPKVNSQNFGLFNSDTVHNCIYTILLLLKYKNLMIPFQYENNDKQIHDLLQLDTLNGFTDDRGHLLIDLLKIYTEYFFEFVPHLILWADSNIFYSSNNLKQHINKIIRADKIRFIMFKLTIIPNSTSTHANVLLYDKFTNELIRFEPYGPVDVMDNSSLNNYISDLMKQTLGNNIKLLFPEDIMIESRFQSVSSDNDPETKKLGDPLGYCLAWVYYFIELRLSNDIDTKKLLKDSFNIILSKKTANSNPFLDYIRNYAAKLDDEKNKYLLSAGINKEDLYNLSYEGERLDKIINKIRKDFYSLI